MFKFLQNETAIIGLKSLGLSTPKKTQKQSTIKTIREKQEQQKPNILISSSQNRIDNTLHLNIASSQKTVEGLFGRERKLNINK